MKKRLRKKLGVGEYAASRLPQGIRIGRPRQVAPFERKPFAEIVAQRLAPQEAGDQLADPETTISRILSEVFPDPQDRDTWLHTPLARFGGRTPANAIESGEAALIALTLLNALAGHPD